MRDRRTLWASVAAYRVSGVLLALLFAALVTR